MAFKSLREFIGKLEAEGELRRVAAEISPRLEITEYTDRVCKAAGPALLFANVTGAEWPVLMNAFGSMRRMAMVLGVDEVESVAREIEALLARQPPRRTRATRRSSCRRFGGRRRLRGRWRWSWLAISGCPSRMGGCCFPIFR